MQLTQEQKEKAQKRLSDLYQVMELSIYMSIVDDIVELELLLEAESNQ